MTVAELVRLLKEMPQNAPVIVRGYEDGFDDVVSVSEEEIALNYNIAWYYGRHEFTKWVRDDDTDSIITTATRRKTSECEKCIAVYLGSNARGYGDDNE